MDFKDPFANDLRNFNSTVSQGLGRPPVARGPSAAAADTMPLRNRGGVSIFGTSNPNPSPSPAAGSSSLFSGMGTNQPSVEALGALGGPIGNAQANRGGAPTAGRRGGSPAPAQTMTWLDTGSVPFDISLTPPPKAAAPPPAARNASENFLDFLEDPNPPPRAAAPAVAQAGAAPLVRTAPVDTAAIEREAKRQKELAERRELLSTLAALEAEEANLSQRLETKEIQEEGELLKLETTLIEKQNELDTKMREKETKLKETKEYTARRLEDMKKRHEENKAELVEEINRTEREKYARQLKQLTDNYKATVDSLTSLRRQRALLIRENGLSEQGILLQLSTAMESSIKSKKKEKSSDSEERSKSEHEYESDFLSASEGQEEEKEEEAEDEEDKTREVSLEPEEEVDAAFDAALQVILRYVDGRLTTVRDGVVDYVHDSTLEAAHEVQLERAKGWTEDAVQRKKELGAYVQEMMNNFLFFYRERGELKQKNITVLREGMRHTAELFREGAKERLASLLTEVTQKLTSASRAFESTVRENALLQERKAAATREGDYSVAEAQLSDVRRRCQTEANVRRTLFQSQMDTLRQQVEKIRHSGDLLSQEQSKSLMERSLQSGRAVEKVQTGLSLLQAKVEQHTNTLKKGNGLDLVTHTAAEELAIRSQDLSRAIALLLEEASQKEGVLRRDRVRLQTAQEEFLHYLETGVVDALRDGRLMRQAEGARLDHLRLAWEKTHRHNLSMPHVFEVEMPTAVPGGKAVTGCSTFTSPLEASLTALLEMLANTLKERDESHRQLRRTRDGQLNTYTKEVHRLCDQYRQLQKEWQRYGEQLEQLEEARGGLVTERVHCGEEAARIAITREVLEGKSRELDRRRRQLERQIQSSAMESEKVQAAYDNQQSSLAKATEERLLEVQRLYAAVPPPVIQKEAPAPHRHRPHRAHDLSQESATPPQPLPSSRVAPDDGASKSSSSKSPIKRKKTANNNAVFHSAGRKQTARREDTVKVGELEESGVSEMATPPSQERSGFQSEATPYRHRDQTLSPFRSSTFTELVSLMESTIYTSS